MDILNYEHSLIKLEICLSKVSVSNLLKYGLEYLKNSGRNIDKNKYILSLLKTYYKVILILCNYMSMLMN